MAAYYPQFDVCKIDADGVRITLAAETIDVYNVTAAASLGTLVSDANGIIAEGSFSAAAGDVIEFSHATYPLTIRTVLKTTQERAYTDVDTNMSAYVVENLAVRATAESADLYAYDLANPGAPPFKIGSGKTGETIEVDYQTNINQQLEIFPVSITEDTKSFSRASFDPANSQVVAVQATDLASLFNFTFIGTTQTAGLGTIVNDGTDFYTHLMLAGTLTEGDSVFAEFAFELLNDGNQKFHEVHFFGAGLGAIDTTLEGSGWMHVTLQVRSGGVIKFSTIAAVQDVGSLSHEIVLNETGEITGLDLAANDYVWEYVVTDLNMAGDSSVIMGNAYKVPAPAVETVTYLISESGNFLYSESGSPLGP